MSALCKQLLYHCIEKSNKNKSLYIFRTEAIFSNYFQLWLVESIESMCMKGRFFVISLSETSCVAQSRWVGFLEDGIKYPLLPSNSWACLTHTSEVWVCKWDPTDIGKQISAMWHFSTNWLLRISALRIQTPPIPASQVLRMPAHHQGCLRWAWRHKESVSHGAGGNCYPYHVSCLFWVLQSPSLLFSWCRRGYSLHLLPHGR